MKTVTSEKLVMLQGRNNSEAPVQTSVFFSLFFQNAGGQPPNPPPFPYLCPCIIIIFKQDESSVRSLLVRIKTCYSTTTLKAY